jgi:hypothetical protein
MKKIINIALATTILSGAALTAHAAETIDPSDVVINMYGASAQVGYWLELGGEFMTAQGCASAAKTNAHAKNYIAIKGTNCSAVGGNDIYITYGSVASLEGVQAAMELAPLSSSLNNTCLVGGVVDNALRETVDLSTCTFPTTWGPYSTTCSMGCADIHAGTSDVESDSFEQTSSGEVNGHLLGGVETFNAFGPDVSALVHYKPTIVPFAFYANNKLGGTSPTGLVNNLSRTQAVNLFAGKIAKWNEYKQFSGYNKNVQLCLRHAGSGTHATLDKVVFRDDTKDATLTLVTAENKISAPYAWFYKSSSDMKTCVETNGGMGNGPSVARYAVGYMDADTANTTNMHQMTYQGAPAVDLTSVGAVPAVGNVYINDGTYDFWSAQSVYVQGADDSATLQALMLFAENHIPAAKSGLWTKAADLKVTKETDKHLPMND